MFKPQKRKQNCSVESGTNLIPLRTAYVWHMKSFKIKWAADFKQIAIGLKIYIEVYGHDIMLVKGFSEHNCIKRKRFERFIATSIHIPSAFELAYMTS